MEESKTASQYYDEGKYLLQEGKKQEAEEKFKKAIESSYSGY